MIRRPKPKTIAIILSAIVFTISNFFLGLNVVPKHNLVSTSFSSEWLLIANDDKKTISNNSMEKNVEDKGDVTGVKNSTEVKNNEDKSDLTREKAAFEDVTPAKGNVSNGEGVQLPFDFAYKKKLQEFYEARRPVNYTKSALTMYGNHRVKESMNRLPQWLREYFVWHAEQRRNPTENTRYLVSVCLNGGRCGGTSDRLRGLPYLLLVAYITQRVLIIKWTKPHDLSEFLMPAGDVDWRSTFELDEMLLDGVEGHRQSVDKFSPIMAGRCGRSSCPVHKALQDNVRKIGTLSDKRYVIFEYFTKSIEQLNDCNNLFQLHSYRYRYPGVKQWEFVDLFGDIFRVMFEPVPRLAHAINATMNTLGLEEGKYVSAHVRSRYPIGKMGRKTKRSMDKEGGFDFFSMKNDFLALGKNAVECVIDRYNSKYDNSNSDLPPIFFVSDSHEFTSSMVTTKQGDNDTDTDINDGWSSQLDIKGIQRNEEPLHIDRDDGWPGSQPSDFFSGFEDLLIMGGSSCVSHGVGSFGAFGAALSMSGCRAVHRIWNSKSASCPNDRADTILIDVNRTLMFGNVAIGDTNWTLV